MNCTDPDHMECPCPCPRCGEWAELHEMVGDTRGNLICKACWKEEREDSRDDE
jgi:hypothetical protein